MKRSCFKNANINKNQESFSCQRQSISLPHKIYQFYGNPKSEGNLQGALLLEKEMIK